MLDPLNIRFIFLALKQNKTMTVAQTRKWMINDGGYTIEEATKVIIEAIVLGFLIPIGSDTIEKIRSTQTIKDNVVLVLKEGNEILSEKNNLRDPYCYECHKPEDLVNCNNCARTFHLNCQRKDLLVPNITNNIKLKDHVSIETHFPDDLSEINSSSIRDPNDNIRSLTSTDDTFIDELLKDIEPSPNKLKEESFENDKIDEKSDVIYVGQVRAPKRRRPNYLSEDFKYTVPDSDNEMELNRNDEMQCTNCQLLKKQSKLDPRNITNDETCYLLQFVFNRIASWIPLDTFSMVPKNKMFHPTTKAEIIYYKKYCFKFPKTLDEIEEKIKNKKYNSLTEFYIDFLDIQHCIGILYGTISEEYLATEYQIKECNYELSEIRQCRDCYRRSNDKNYIKDWFCKPCLPRHELVYAKKAPWPYWPAKVMKFKDNKYDVRFFSEKHERAIIDAKYIKPIELYTPTKTSSALQNAIRKLQKYLHYDQQPVGTFSFEQERVIERTVTPMKLLNKNKEIKTTSKRNISRKVPSLTANQINDVTIVNNSITDNEIQSNELRSKRFKKINQKHKTNINSKNKIKNNSNKKFEYYDIVKQLGKKIDKIHNKNDIKKLVMDTMQNELKLLKDKIEIQNTEILEAKTKLWCKWCLEPATLHCCENTSYCSTECQKKDWHHEHELKCRHKVHPRY